jgi:hypothetical protein
LKEAVASHLKTALPEVQIREQLKKQVAEIVGQHAGIEIPKIDIPQSLLDHVQVQFRQQNETIARIVKAHGSLPSSAFGLPQGWSEIVAEWRGRLEAEGVLEQGESAAERLRRVADERQRIVTDIARCSAVFESCRWLGIPVPPSLCALILIAYVLADVAAEILDERHDLD